MVIAGLAILLNRGNRLDLSLHDALRQRRVGEGLGHLLSRSQHPPQEIGQNQLLGGVLDPAWNEQPGETGDRIGALAGALVMETRKSSGMLAAAPAAAAVTEARSG